MIKAEKDRKDAEEKEKRDKVQQMLDDGEISPQQAE